MIAGHKIELKKFRELNLLLTNDKVRQILTDIPTDGRNESEGQRNNYK